MTTVDPVDQVAVDQAAAPPDDGALLVSRDEFLATRWRYRPGEHVTILGPTDCGKTTLGFQLLARSIRPKLPAIVFAMKPRDATVKTWAKALRFRTVRSWPPMPSIWTPGVNNPPGWVLWPKHTFEPERDDYNHYVLFRSAIINSYKKGNRILFCDETYGLTAELKLERPLVTVWSRGRSMGTGLWAASQKPSHIPLWAYNQAQHLFLYYDPDKRSRERFAEIGGIDPKAVEAAVMSLKPHQCLYIRRNPRAWCIIDA